MTGSGAAIPASAPGEGERRWRTTRRAADLAWMLALLIAIPSSPVARFYLLSWPGVAEWSLVVVIAGGIVMRTTADRRLRMIQSETARAAGREPTPDDVTTPPRQRVTTAVGWMVVVLLLPVVWACLIDPLIAAMSFDWGPTRPSGVFETVLIATFLICPYLVGLLVWWLARGVGSTPERLIVAILVASATGLLAYGSLGYVPPMLSWLM